MANNIDIALRAKDEASRAMQTASARLAELRGEIDKLRGKGEINLTVADSRNLSRLTSEAGRLEKALGSVSGAGVKAGAGVNSLTSGLSGLLSSAGLGGLTTLIGPMGLAGVAAGAAKAALSLEVMREESAQLEARFVGFAGGVQEADTALRAMNDTVGNALSRDEKMAAATQLLGLGIASTAQEAATLTNQALILGINIQTLTQALETGRVTGLVQYGISVSDVKERAEELQRATVGLSDAEAKAIAIREQLALKSDQVAEAGGRAATATEELGNAFDTFKDSVADLVNLEGGLTAITRIITGASNDIAGRMALEMSLDTTNAEQQLIGITTRLEYLRELVSRGVGAQFASGFDTDEAEAEITALERKLFAVTAANQEAGASAGVAAIRMVDGYGQAAAAAAALAGEVEALADRDPNRLRMAQGYGQKSQAERNVEEYFRAYNAEQARSQAATEKSQATSGRKVATESASAWKAAMTAAASEVQGALSSAMGASKGLFDFTGTAGNPFAPGANGPFEAIYRAQAVAVGGIETDQERQWAEMYGLTPESAARIVGDFQKGLFSPEVTKLIDVDALTSQIQGEQAAAESSQAFAKMIAGRLGVKGAGALVASETFQAISGGVAANPIEQATAAQDVLNAYAGSVDEVVKGRDFAGRMIGYGKNTWGYYEQGLLQGASASRVFVDAVQAAVNALMQGDKRGAQNQVLRNLSGSGSATP